MVTDAVPSGEAVTDPDAPTQPLHSVTTAAREHATAVDRHLAEVAAFLRAAGRQAPTGSATASELSAALAELSGLLLTEAKVDTLLKRVSELAIRSVAACDAVGVTLQRDGRFETAVWTDEIVAELDGGQYRTGEGPCVDSIRDRRRYVIDSMATERRWPSYTPVAASRGVQAALSLPMLAGGEALGALNLYARTPSAFGGRSVEIAQALADQAAVALANTRLYAEQRSLATTLQQRLLPARLPRVGGIRLGAHYQPGTEGINVGGDWYDATPLPAGRVGLMIGDVAGHGLQAATIMGQLRTALRAYVLDGYGPAAVVRRLDRFLSDLDPEAYATCCYLVCDPARGEIRWANAGHPAPLVLGPDKVTTSLEGGHVPPLGVIGAIPVRERYARIRPGSVLLLYTDGLVERRGEPLDHGMRRLADSLAGTLGGDHDDLGSGCETLVTKLLMDGQASDDVAVIAMRLLARP